MRFLERSGGFLTAAAVVIVLTGSVVARQPAQREIGVPANAVALQGTPLVRIDTDEGQVTRHQLTGAEIGESRLTINVDHGRYFWTSRGNTPLTLSSSGEFTYLSSSEPGRYVRFRRLNDRITYVEHVDMPQGSVTYWGELRIVLAK
jgi:hypothetical protein